MRCARGSRASLSAPRRTISPKLPLSFFLGTSRPPLLVARLPKEALINHYALARFNLRRAACAPSKIPQLYATSQDVVVAPGLQEPPRRGNPGWSRMSYVECVKGIIPNQIDRKKTSNRLPGRSIPLEAKLQREACAGSCRTELSRDIGRTSLGCRTMLPQRPRG